jgi:hypothetical protein
VLTIKNVDNTNSRHLELYTVLGEYDNAGFPLSYCLLTTASSVEDRKRTKALEAWAAILREEHSVVPRFVHTDKDMAEIGASRRIWPEAKHQLCWWHQREAVRRRLKGNLPTLVYNAPRAVREHAFINIAFKPYGRVDPSDIEGGVPGEICEQGIQAENANTIPLTGGGPNSIKIRIPVVHLMHSSQTAQNVGDNVGVPNLASSRPNAPEVATHSATNTRENAGETTLAGGCPNLLGVSVHSATDAGDKVGGPTLAGGCTDLQGVFGHPPDTSKLTIRIPAPSTICEAVPVTEDEPDSDEDISIGRRTFCPIEHCAWLWSK